MYSPRYSHTDSVSLAHQSTNFTRPGEQFCGAREKWQVSGAEYSSAEEKPSIDKHKVKGIPGTDRENRDARIT